MKKTIMLLNMLLISSNCFALTQQEAEAAVRANWRSQLMGAQADMDYNTNSQFRQQVDGMMEDDAITRARGAYQPSQSYQAPYPVYTPSNPPVYYNQPKNNFNNVGTMNQYIPNGNFNEQSEYARKNFLQLLLLAALKSKE